MNDWEIITTDSPYEIRTHRSAIVSENKTAFHATAEFKRYFPGLNILLGSARTYTVELPQGEFLLFAWDRIDGEVTAWLSPAAQGNVEHLVCKAHNILLSCFGGMSNMFNHFENNNWLLSHRHALIASDAKHDASVINDYSWAFEECGGIPIDPADYYSIALEANGNTHFCERTSGRLILFAADHAFDDVTPLEGCPENTLYTRDGVYNFEEWVETIAAQWLDNVRHESH